MAGQHVYRVKFHNQGSVYEVYARSVSDGGLFGFIQVADLLFGDASKLVIDPSEERLAAEFRGVKAFHVPLHAVIRVDEVEREGQARITALEGGKVSPFPVPIYAARTEPTPPGSAPER